MRLDFNDLGRKMDALNSALSLTTFTDDVAHEQQVMAEITRQNAENASTLLAGAEASIEQKELLEQQLDFVRKQNELLMDNYGKLKEMYDAQVQANLEAKEELKRNKRFNAWMMVIAIVAMFAAIAGPIVTVAVSR